MAPVCAGQSASSVQRSAVVWQKYPTRRPHEVAPIVGEQYPPTPQLASTRQLPGTHALPEPPLYGEPWHAQVWPAGQAESCGQMS